MYDPEERRYLESARVGRLATADAEGRPTAVPVCFALDGTAPVTPIDEKPKAAGTERLRRVSDVRENSACTLLVDHYVEDWSRLGWLQVRGTAAVLAPDAPDHPDGVAALEAKYDQYAAHDLAGRPLIRLSPGHVRTWGRLRRPEPAAERS